MTDWDSAFKGNLQAGSSPALLLVDPVKAYVEPSSPLYLETGFAALEKMAELLAQFRRRNLPVVFTGVRYEADGSDGGYFFKKVPALEVFAGDNPLGEFPDTVTPSADDKVFIKQYPSAFFGTELAEWLGEQGIDTVFIAGFSTSGCVRASALDALQHGFIPFTVADACADRNESTHAGNLHDLGAKYSEIVSAEAVGAILDGKA